MIGRYKKKLEAQRQLTQTLVQSHSRAETQAELLEQELKRWEELVNGLRGSERRYEQARRQMIDNDKEKGGAHAEALIGLEKR